ncbi:apical endosomal glycoprotein [Amblyraja radiata]|uniref:apical endosomal glycoprotein n=1 Tax=Amblyraja radiata TaxID=386614 RepID=UPI001402193F|nr:apical endosomal glycoprotein [Amblyraja radiata]
MYDHTINARGHYLFVGPTSGNHVQATAGLISRLQTASACHQCLAFWYYMYGPKVGDLRLKVQQRGQGEALLWSRAASQGNEWRRGYLTIAPQLRYFQLIFEGSRTDGSGSIAIDDISVVGGSCEPQQFCSFEADSCSFTSTGARTWQRESGDSGTRTKNRPPIDSTLGTGQGHYMLANTSHRPLPTGQRLQLVSETQNPLDIACLQFRVHTSADSPGSLDVYMEEDLETKRLVWTLDTGPLQTWTLARVGVHTAHGWRLVFEAAGGGASSSYIAIDDLVLEPSRCPRPGTCNFEAGLCGWRNVLNQMDTVDWNWSSSSVPGHYKTPATDHTLGTPEGHSVFVDMATVSVTDTARLLSEHLPPTKGSCLTFYYRTKIPQQLAQGPLKFFQLVADQETTLWEAKHGANDQWRGVNLTVASAESFQVGFLVKKSNAGETGYIAIDDVDYRPGVNCFGVNTDQAVGGAGNTAGIVVAGILVVVLLLGLAVATMYWYKNRSASFGRSLNELRATFGFDNISYRNRNKDTVPVETVRGFGVADP